MNFDDEVHVTVGHAYSWSDPTGLAEKQDAGFTAASTLISDTDIKAFTPVDLVNPNPSDVDSFESFAVQFVKFPSAQTAVSK